MSPLPPNSLSVEAAAGKSGDAQSLTSTPSAPGFSPHEFSDDERGALLRLAHDSISSALRRCELSLDPPTPHLSELRGAFTSLYLRPSHEEKDFHGEHHPEKELRGCVGYILPNCSVYRAVAETARAAAFDDNRFPPVSKAEAPHLLIELSILSPPKPIPPEEVEVGRHGLLISWHGRRGLLLPQVPVERRWDRIAFLEQTCRKAGLPMDAWQKGACIEAFTAEVFGEKGGQ